MADSGYSLPPSQLPIAYFHDLARSVIKASYYIWVLGGPKEANVGEKIIQVLGNDTVNLWATLSLSMLLICLLVAQKRSAMIGD